MIRAKRAYVIIMVAVVVDLFVDDAVITRGADLSLSSGADFHALSFLSFF